MPDDSGALAPFNAFQIEQLRPLRQLIIDTAAKTPVVGPLVESTKWGEPSYTPARKGIGSSVRIAPRKDGKVSMNFICHTGLVDRFREIYRQELVFEGNRTIVIDPALPLPETQLRHCIAIALSYFVKSRP